MGIYPDRWVIGGFHWQAPSWGGVGLLERTVCIALGVDSQSPGGHTSEVQRWAKEHWLGGHWEGGLARGDQYPLLLNGATVQLTQPGPVDTGCALSLLASRSVRGAGSFSLAWEETVCGKVLTALIWVPQSPVKLTAPGLCSCSHKRHSA